MNKSTKIILFQKHIIRKAQNRAKHHDQEENTDELIAFKQG